MTQEAQEYRIWKPEHDGHAPPNWREGMKWGLLPDGRDFDVLLYPSWSDDTTYYVPPEALNSPNDDAMNELARRGWEYSFADLVDVLRKLPPEELAKHGITLAPEKDWADILWVELTLVAQIDGNQAATEYLRTRFEQMKGEG